MSLRVRTPDGGLDHWEAAGDERSWFDYTHAVDHGDLVIFLHSFRRVRERIDQKRDRLLWKHRTTKIARRYPAGAWVKVVRARKQTPPATSETVPHVPRERAPFQPGSRQ